MIRRSLLDFFNRHKYDINDNGAFKLSFEERVAAETFIKNVDFHRILRNQLIFNPIPKRMKTKLNEFDRADHERHSIRGFVKRVSKARKHCFNQFN